jgi:hypothetical protein
MVGLAHGLASVGQLMFVIRYQLRVSSGIAPQRVPRWGALCAYVAIAEKPRKGWPYMSPYSDTVLLGESRRLFEFPVYRVAPDVFITEHDALVAKELERMGYVHPGRSLPSERIMTLTAGDIWETYGQYAYNQIVGWIRLCSAGMLRRGCYATIKGYYSRRDTKRIMRNCQAKFEGSRKCSEFSVSREDDDAEICERFRNEVLRLTNSGHCFEGRHIDFEIFDSIAPYVNWHALLNIDPETG